MALPASGAGYDSPLAEHGRYGLAGRVVPVAELLAHLRARPGSVATCDVRAMTSISNLDVPDVDPRHVTVFDPSVHVVTDEDGSG